MNSTFYAKGARIFSRYVITDSELLYETLFSKRVIRLQDVESICILDKNHAERLAKQSVFDVLNSWKSAVSLPSEAEQLVQYNKIFSFLSTKRFLVNDLGHVPPSYVSPTPYPSRIHNIGKVISLKMKDNQFFMISPRNIVGCYNELLKRGMVVTQNLETSLDSSSSSAFDQRPEDTRIWKQKIVPMFVIGCSCLVGVLFLLLQKEYGPSLILLVFSIAAFSVVKYSKNK